MTPVCAPLGAVLQPITDRILEFVDGQLEPLARVAERVVETVTAGGRA